MASFTDTISDPKNQIGVYSPQADNTSSLLIQAASNIAGPLVADIHKARVNSKLDEVSASMTKEYQRLAEARRQGTIDTPEFFTRLNARMRQITADFPSIATEIRGRIQQDFGADPSQQAYAATIDTFKQQEDLENKIFAEAQSNGFLINDKGGKPDRRATIKSYTGYAHDVAMAQMKAKVSPQSYGERKDQHVTEIYGHIQNGLNTTFAPAMQQMLTLADQMKGSPDAQTLTVLREKFASLRRNFVAHAVFGTVNGSQLSPEDSDKIVTSMNKQLDLMQSMLFGEKGDNSLGAFRSQARMVEDLVNDKSVKMTGAMPGFVAASQVLGAQALSTAVQNWSTTSAIGGNFITDELDKVNSLNDHVSKVTEAVTGVTDISTASVEDRKILAKTGQAMINDIAKVSDPTQSDYRTLIGSSHNILVNAAMSSNNIDTQTGAVATLSQPQVMMKVSKAAEDPELAPAAKELGQGMNDLSAKVLKNAQIRVYENIRKQVGDRGDILYNPVKQRFELVMNPDAVLSNIRAIGQQAGGLAGLDTEQGRNAVVQRTIRNVTERTAGDVNKLNQALTLYAQSAKLSGVDKNIPDAELKQYAANRYGYKTNPLYSPVPVSDKLLGGKQLNDSQQSPNPSNAPIPEYDYVDGKLIPKGGK